MGKKRIEELRDEKDWSQDNMTEAVNAVLEKNPHLKKITKRNPDGLVDQQTVQRIEKGKIKLDERWLEILRLTFPGVRNEWLLTGELPKWQVDDLNTFIPDDIKEILYSMRDQGDQEFKLLSALYRAGRAVRQKNEG